MSPQPRISDRLVAGLDNLLQTVLAPSPEARRGNPADETPDNELSGEERDHAAGLMRINQAGEVAAQGLYQGHALVARSDANRHEIGVAAEEERDHLAWCTRRLDELGARPSALNGLWYTGAFAIGALSGVAGDRYGLGFIAETERQVVRHLEDHLARLPESDTRSRAILSRMRDEEAQHGANADKAGAATLPPIARTLMRGMAKIMTTTAYRF